MSVDYNRDCGVHPFLIEAVMFMDVVYYQDVICNMCFIIEAVECILYNKSCDVYGCIL